MVEMPDVGVKVLVEVESHNGKAKFEGIVLHPAADGHLTLKLANGYNASYPANDILSVEIIEAPQNNDIQQSSDFEFDEKLEQLRIIDTNEIGISIVKEEILGVDTKEDLDRVNQLILKK